MGVLQKLMQEQYTSFWLAFVQKMGNARDIHTLSHQFCDHFKGVGRCVAITEGTGVGGNRDEQCFGNFRTQWIFLLLNQIEYDLAGGRRGYVQIVYISVTGVADMMV